MMAKIHGLGKDLKDLCRELQTMRFMARYAAAVEEYASQVLL